jgi:hypothetical protein
MVFSRSLSWLPVRWPTCPRSSASRLPGHTACGFLWRHICRVVVVLIVHEDPPVAVRARVRGSSIQRSMLPAFQVAISKLRFSMFFDVSVPRLNQFEERRSIRHRGLLFSRDPAQPSAFLRKKLMPACQSLLRSSWLGFLSAQRRCSPRLELPAPIDRGAFAQAVSLSREEWYLLFAVGNTNVLKPTKISGYPSCNGISKNF